jgi:hypothetical protein
MNAGAGICGGETCVKSIVSMSFKSVYGKVMYVFILTLFVLCLTVNFVVMHTEL